MNDSKNAYHIGACEVLVIPPSPSMPYNQYHMVVGGVRIRSQISRPGVEDVLQALSNGTRDHLISQENKRQVLQSLNGQRQWGTRLVSVDIDKLVHTAGPLEGPRGQMLAKRPLRQVALEEEETETTEEE